MKKFIFVSAALLVASAIVPALAVSTLSGKKNRTIDQPVAQEEFGTPKVALEKTEFNFGRLDPETKQAFDFEIKNEGDGVLQISKKGHSCNCIKVQLDKAAIPPGGSAIARVMWDTRFATDYFSHFVSVKTNDPEKPEFRLKILGVVAQKMGVDPKLINLPPLSINSPIASRKVLVYSQLYEDFEIDKISTDIKGAKTEFRKAEKEELGLRNAKCGYWVGVSVDYAKQKESFFSNIAMTYRPLNEDGKFADKPEQLVIPVGGTVRGRLTMFGDKRINDKGVIRFGSVTPARGDSIDLSLLINDENKSLAIKRVTSNPTFIKTSLNADGIDGAKKGRYRLKIELPKDQCHGVYTDEKPAVLRIEFDHPSIAPVRLMLLFTTLDTPFKKT